MLVVLIVVPAVIVAVAVVVVLDRLGVLPHMEGQGSSGWNSSSGSFMESIPKAGLWAAGAVMALWILAWLLFLVIGLSVLAG